MGKAVCYCSKLQLEVSRFHNGPVEAALSLSLSAQNLFTITRYSGPDPEVNATGTEDFGGGDSLVRGQDFATLQTPRQFTATLHVGF
ncbi:MAG: hypothetical protein BRD55_03440 [Bacteroidetes bacterium SW_9_63_38]|nr:MAG: hypothetical protein BRD55_03440 [Bacteroidetes bacterium SW_9_63_38]